MPSWRSERSGLDYDVLVRRARPEFAVIAPHGGGIEPGTSEIADAVADRTHSFYTFEGLKTSRNTDLHITSTRFDEPMCLTVLGHTEVVVTLHGEHSKEDDKVVFLGGLDTVLGERIRTALTRKGFDVRTHQNPDPQGHESSNLCNRGLTAAGVQLELSNALRESMFESLTRTDRKKTTEQFKIFVNALRGALDRPLRRTQGAPPSYRRR